MSTDFLVIRSLFEAWLRPTIKRYALMSGGELNSLVQMTKENWWPFKDMGLVLIYDSKYLYRVSKEGIFILRELYANKAD